MCCPPSGWLILDLLPVLHDSVQRAWLLSLLGVLTCWAYTYPLARLFNLVYLPRCLSAYVHKGNVSWQLCLGQPSNRNHSDAHQWVTRWTYFGKDKYPLSIYLGQEILEGLDFEMFVYIQWYILGVRLKFIYPSHAWCHGTMLILHGVWVHLHITDLSHKGKCGVFPGCHLIWIQDVLDIGIWSFLIWNSQLAYQCQISQFLWL